MGRKLRETSSKAGKEIARDDFRCDFILLSRLCFFDLLLFDRIFLICCSTGGKASEFKFNLTHVLLMAIVLVLLGILNTLACNSRAPVKKVPKKKKE
jgi:hypothetical protein